MKTLFLLAILCIISPACAQQAFTDTDTITIGDLNSDRVIDTAFVVGPKWLNDDDGWGDPTIQPYEVDIRFSGNLPSIHVANAVMAEIENIGDVDGDGYSEVIVVPIWFIGCWGRMEFYTYKDGAWRNFGEAACHICTEDERYSNSITKSKNGRIEVIEYVWDDDVADRVKKIKKLKVIDWKKWSSNP